MLFRRTLPRPWHRNAAFLGYDSYRLRKRTLVHFHHEFEDVPARAAAEAVINLSHWMHGERRRLFLVERAQPREILASLLQANVFADHADDVRLLLHLLRE